MAAIWVSRMPGPEMAAVVRSFVEGSGSSAASARIHCIGSKPIGRTTTSSRASGSSSSSASPTSALISDSIPAELTSSSRFSSQAPPWPPNATAYGSPECSRSTSACVPASGSKTWPLSESFSPAVVGRCWSWIVTSYFSLRVSFRAYRSSWLSWAPAALRAGPLRFGVESGWSRPRREVPPGTRGHSGTHPSRAAVDTPAVLRMS